MFLVDTNVISAGAPSRAAPPGDLAGWMDRHSPELFLSAVTIAEIEDGIAKARRSGARRKAGDLEAWLETLLHLYADQILPLDIEIARLCGRMSDAVRASGRTSGFADLIIAATAMHHGLTLLTRNIRHFAFPGLRVINPYDGLPD